MELSAPTVNDILLKAERRLSKISPSEHNSADPIDNLENPPQELKVRGDGSKHPAATALEPRFVPSKTTQQSKSDDDAGSRWFGLPRTRLTPGLKRDFQVLRLRAALDPKVHYKKSAAKSLVPRFSHIGEIVEGPTEFNSARLTKRERKITFADEVLSARGLTERSKSKYSGIQRQKSSGKKAYYKSRRRLSHS